MAKLSFLDVVKKDMLTESASYYDINYKNQLILESIMEDNTRVLQTPNEFIDLMSEMSGGKKFVSFGYISGANLNIPQVKKLNLATNRMKNFNDFEEMGRQLGYEGGIGGIIKFTRLLVNFQTQEEMGKDYGKFKEKSSEIRSEFGVPEIQKKDGDYAGKINYGTQGLKGYEGDNDELKGHMYTDQNVYSAYNQGNSPIKRKQSAYYVISTDGKILKELNKNEVDEMFAKFGKPSQYSSEVDKLHQSVGGKDSGLTALRKINADDETMKEYLKKIADLKFIYRRFEYSSIVFMVGTCDGQKFYYVNRNLTKMPSGVGVEIDPNEFITLANNKYAKTLDEIDKVALNDVSNQNI